MNKISGWADIAPDIGLILNENPTSGTGAETKPACTERPDAAATELLPECRSTTNSQATSISGASRAAGSSAHGEKSPLDEIKREEEATNCPIDAKPLESALIKVIGQLPLPLVKRSSGLHCDLSSFDLKALMLLIDQASRIEQLDYFRITLTLLDVVNQRLTSQESGYETNSPNLEKLLDFIGEKSHDTNESAD